MRSLVLCIVVLFFVLVQTPGTDQLLPGCHTTNAQAGTCTSTLIDSASGYVPELGVSWSSQTYWSACEDRVGNITFHYTTMFVMVSDSGAMWIHINIA